MKKLPLLSVVIAAERWQNSLSTMRSANVLVDEYLGGKSPKTSVVQKGHDRGGLMLAQYFCFFNSFLLNKYAQLVKVNAVCCRNVIGLICQSIFLYFISAEMLIQTVMQCMMANKPFQNSKKKSNKNWVF